MSRTELNRTKVLKALQSGKKIRSETWYWGKYIHYKDGKLRDEKDTPFPEKYVPFNSHEIYEEEKHGKHMEQKCNVKTE